MGHVITDKKDIKFKLTDLPVMQKPNSVLMVRPTYFSVDYVINPHMEGNVGKVDKEKAMMEWEKVKSAFELAGVDVHVIDGEEGLPDMVFCANQSLPYYSEEGGKEVLMSIMNSKHRKDEVQHVERWYMENGYEIHHLNYKKIDNFEGMGDAIWHSGRKLLWGGYGFRSSLDAYDFVSDKWDVPVIALELNDPAFYHLDTCFCMLNQDSVLIYPKAFTQNGVDIIKSLFKNVIEADEYEAKELFACNATCPNGKHVIIQRGAEKVNQQLKDAGFEVIEVDTSQFLLSGGSVFCMKMMVW